VAFECSPKALMDFLGEGLLWNARSRESTGALLNFGSFVSSLFWGSGLQESSARRRRKRNLKLEETWYKWCTEGLYRWNLGLQFLAYWGHLVEKLCLGEGPWNCSRLVAGNGMNWIRVEEKLGHSRRELENRIEGWHQIQSPS
jgi:hypothetical protein